MSDSSDQDASLPLWERRVRRFMRRRHQGIAALKPDEAENYLVAAMREIDRLRAENAALRAFQADVEHALRPCNGTTYADIDGRNAAEVAVEMVYVWQRHEAALTAPSVPGDNDV